MGQDGQRSQGNCNHHREVSSTIPSNNIKGWIMELVGHLFNWKMLTDLVNNATIILSQRYNRGDLKWGTPSRRNKASLLPSQSTKRWTGPPCPRGCRVDMKSKWMHTSERLWTTWELQIQVQCFVVTILNKNALEIGNFGHMANIYINQELIKMIKQLKALHYHYEGHKKQTMDLIWAKTRAYSLYLGWVILTSFKIHHSIQGCGATRRNFHWTRITHCKMEFLRHY